MLANYRGYLQTDGYSAYTAVVGLRRSSTPTSRARRTPGGSSTKRGLQPTTPCCTRPWAGFSSCTTWKIGPGPGLPQIVWHLRLTEAAPILDRMQTRFDVVARTVHRQTGRGGRVRAESLLRRPGGGGATWWTHLLRGIAVGRKNYLFVGSREGGNTAARLYTIVQGAKRHNLAVSPYLNDVLRHCRCSVESGHLVGVPAARPLGQGTPRSRSGGTPGRITSGPPAPRPPSRPPRRSPPGRDVVILPVTQGGHHLP